MRIELQDLTKNFGTNCDVLRAIDFADDVRALAVIGPSGGGKSTLLRLLGGLIAPTAGRITVAGKDVEIDTASLEAHRRKIGFVFQHGGLFKHLNARSNITLPLIKVHGYTKDEARARADELLTRFGMITEAEKYPALLSGGQQQRVAIARAIAAKPKLLLLDEPTSALDPEYTTEVLNIIKELKDESLDFIIVTHEMGFARHACEKVLFLSAGKLLEYGRSEEVFLAPKTDELRHFLSKLLEWNV